MRRLCYVWRMKVIFRKCGKLCSSVADLYRKLASDSRNSSPRAWRVSCARKLWTLGRENAGTNTRALCCRFSTQDVVLVSTLHFSCRLFNFKVCTLQKSTKAIDHPILWQDITPHGLPTCYLLFWAPPPG